jgi:hypothetical protein
MQTCVHCDSIPDEGGLCPPESGCPCRGLPIGSPEARRASSNWLLGFRPWNPAPEPVLPSAEIVKGVLYE